MLYWIDVVRAVAKLSKCCEVAVDTEFDRDLFSYGFTLCLIQVFGGGQCYIFDPLAKVDLNPLYKSVLENGAITKIFHAPREDLELFHKIKIYPKNIFDRYNKISVEIMFLILI